MASPRTPPTRTTPLSGDTHIVPRHTSGAGYRSGDLNRSRQAVLADLQRYLQVPFHQLARCVGTVPSPDQLHRIRQRLVDEKLLACRQDGKFRWAQFKPPNQSALSEENAFKPLAPIISSILEQVPGCRASFRANPNQSPLSQRSNTSRPDAYLVLTDKVTPVGVHWFDVAVPFEFKRDASTDDIRDVSPYSSCSRRPTNSALGRT